MKILGKPVADELTSRLRNETNQLLNERGIVPCLAIVRLGERPDDLSYERGAAKRCATVGIELKKFILPPNTTQAEVLETIEKINRDATIHGCLIFMPLPVRIDERAIRAALLTEKDVDGITMASQAGVYASTGVGYPPCTAEACIEILKHYDIPIDGAKAVILGRSLVIGKPLAMMLLKENATVTICHTHTKNLQATTREADILISAMGRAESVDGEFLAPHQTVIDVGINVDADGKICGDLSPSAVETPRCYTPVPGGVGAVTTSILAKHVVQAAQKSAN